MLIYQYSLSVCPVQAGVILKVTFVKSWTEDLSPAKGGVILNKLISQSLYSFGELK